MLDGGGDTIDTHSTSPDYLCSLVNDPYGLDTFKELQKQLKEKHPDKKLVKMFRRIGGWKNVGGKKGHFNHDYKVGVPGGKPKHATHFDVYTRNR